jgi:acetylornithine aminotransferase
LLSNSARFFVGIFFGYKDFQMIEELLSQDKELFLPLYRRLPIEISHGEGVYLYDKNGTRYLDLFAGLAVNALGYAHPKIVSAVTKQISRFAHVSNNFLTEPQIALARRLLSVSGQSKVFFSNSGTEAIEAALKIIRKKQGSEKTIYSFTGSFHGRTYGALSLTAQPKYQHGFEPLLPGIQNIPFNDLAASEQNINSNTAAVVLEFLQGEGGINEASPEFVEKLASLRERFHFIIVSDCIQCGIGRTGKPFSHNYYGIQPDIIVTAKSIGGGLPLGAVLVSDALANVLSIGQHGTTFGGNPVSCAAGNVVLEEVFEHGLMENAFTLGNYWKEELKKLQSEFPDKILKVTGHGFMLGIGLSFPGKPVIDRLFERGILSNCTHETVIRLLPPLILQQEHIDLFLKEFRDIIAGS